MRAATQRDDLCAHLLRMRLCSHLCTTINLSLCAAWLGLHREDVKKVYSETKKNKYKRNKTKLLIKVRLESYCIVYYL